MEKILIGLAQAHPYMPGKMKLIKSAWPKGSVWPESIDFGTAKLPRNPIDFYETRVGKNAAKKRNDSAHVISLWIHHYPGPMV